MALIWKLLISDIHSLSIFIHSWSLSLLLSLMLHRSEIIIATTIWFSECCLCPSDFLFPPMKARFCLHFTGISIPWQKSDEYFKSLTSKQSTNRIFHTYTIAFYILYGSNRYVWIFLLCFRSWCLEKLKVFTFYNRFSPKKIFTPFWVKVVNAIIIKQ